MKVYPISFTGQIIDAHVHSGNWWRNGNLIDHTGEIDTFTKQPLPNGDTVERVVVSNLDCMVRVNKDNEPIKFISDETEGNIKLVKLAENNPKIIPLATCQPGYGLAQNISKLLENYPDKFLGLKFHPEQLNIAADSEVYTPYMNIAKEHNLPCLFHSGQSLDTQYVPASKVSKPQQIYNLAKKFPEVPVIMAHMGGNEGNNTMAAVDCIINSIKNHDAKLYADISWVDCDNPQKPTLKEAIKRLKDNNALDRIMFGTDAPLARFGFEGEKNISPINSYTDNINHIKAMIKQEFGQEADNIIEKIFHKNAEDLFINKSWLPQKPKPENISKSFSKTKIAIIFAGVVSILAGLSILISKTRCQQVCNPSSTVNQSYVIK